MAARAHLVIRISLDRVVDADWTASRKDQQDQELLAAIVTHLGDADLPFGAQVMTGQILEARSESLGDPQPANPHSGHDAAPGERPTVAEKEVVVDTKDVDKKAAAARATSGGSDPVAP